MIVSELITKLQKLPQDALVIVGDGPDGRPNRVEWCTIITGKDVHEQILHDFTKQKIVEIQGENY